MKYRSLLFGALMLALTLVTTTAQAQTFDESSSDESSSTSSSSSSMGSSSTSSSANTAPAPASSSSSSSGGGGGVMAGENSLSSGKSSLAFTVPSGGNPYAAGTVGYWYMVTDSVNLGINVGLGLESNKYNYDTDNEESRMAFDMLLAPAIRYYLMNDSAVAPYILGQLNFHKFWDGNDDTTGNYDEAKDDGELGFNPEEQIELALIGGFGLEWFPVKFFSIGGHIGLGVDILRQDQIGGQSLTRTGLRVGTFTSALTANIYF